DPRWRRGTNAPIMARGRLSGYVATKPHPGSGYTRAEGAIMLIERIWAANSYRNFHYLIACPETGEALAVDPLEWRLCLDAARQKGWTITQILNTHEHLDHTGGNEGLVGATQAKVLAHAGAAKRIGGVDRGLIKGDVIKVGRTVVLECMDTPGHTMAHI